MQMFSTITIEAWSEILVLARLLYILDWLQLGTIVYMVCIDRSGWPVALDNLCLILTGTRPLYNFSTVVWNPAFYEMQILDQLLRILPVYHHENMPI